jgi:hypothetical protein
MTLRKVLVAPVVLTAALLMCAATARATNINASTGFTSYTIISDTTGEGLVGGLAPIVSTMGSNWTNVAGALWIAPNTFQSSLYRSIGNYAGNTQYQTTFSLSGLDPTSAVMSLNLSAEDSVKVFLNGTLIFANSSPNLWTQVVSFSTVSSGLFVSGVNTLTFDVTNSGLGATGLSAQVSVTANPFASTPPPAAITGAPIGTAPEPASGGLMVSALAAVLYAGRRRLKQSV